MRTKEIEIKVIPNSKEETVIEPEAEAELKPLIVRVKEPPIKGKANKAVVKLLSRYFNARVRIVSGTNSRRKIVAIEEWTKR
ncbi:MAG: hypothetical protein C4B56_06700 [Candidatus Methanophagaceae archaeon]|nr:MAG: hypothetical protein C4B56_06700 [Methanophagales archaeon]